MTVHDRIRLIDRLREGPATAGLFYATTNPVALETGGGSKPEP